MTAAGKPPPHTKLPFHDGGKKAAAPQPLHTATQSRHKLNCCYLTAILAVWVWEVPRTART